MTFHQPKFADPLDSAAAAQMIAEGRSLLDGLTDGERAENRALEERYADVERTRCSKCQCLFRLSPEAPSTICDDCWKAIARDDD